MSTSLPVSASRARLAQAQFDGGDVLVLVDPAAALAHAAAINGEVQVHALGGDARHGPALRDRLERVEPEPGLFVRLAPGGLGRIGFIDDAGDRLERVRLARRVIDRNAELAHQHRRPPLGVVGQHAGRGAVILDLAAEGAAVREADRRDQILGPAGMHGFDVGDFHGARSRSSAKAVRPQRFLRSSLSGSGSHQRRLVEIQGRLALWRRYRATRARLR